MSDSQNAHLSHNRRVQISGAFFSKLGDALSNSKIVLPALLQAIGAPNFFIAMIAPIRESFSMLPQLFIKDWVKASHHPNRIYTLGGLGQGAAILLMLASFVLLEGPTGGAAILGGLFLMSLSRSLCSLSSKTVLGNTIPKSKRGNLMGTAASYAGFISMLLGGLLLYLDFFESTPHPAETSGNQESAQAALASSDEILISLLGFSALTFLVAATCYAFIRLNDGDRSKTSKQATEQEKKAQEDGLLHSAISLLKHDRLFRRFVITRALMMVSALALPLVVSAALSNRDGDISVLAVIGSLIIIEGIANLVGGRIWGNFADHDSKRVLVVTASIAAILCMISAAFGYVRGFESLWLWVAIYAGLTITHQGVRLGRKTYVVDLADEHKEGDSKRTEYVAVSNSCIGILLLVVGVLSASLAQLSLSVAFLAFALCALAALVMSRGLKSI